MEALQNIIMKIHILPTHTAAHQVQYKLISERLLTFEIDNLLWPDRVCLGEGDVVINQIESEIEWYKNKFLIWLCR